jgi:hypothetical protein
MVISLCIINFDTICATSWNSNNKKI